MYFIIRTQNTTDSLKTLSTKLIQRFASNYIKFSFHSQLSRRINKTPLVNMIVLRIRHNSGCANICLPLCIVPNAYLRTQLIRFKMLAAYTKRCTPRYKERVRSNYKHCKLGPKTVSFSTRAQQLILSHP